MNGIGFIKKLYICALCVLVTALLGLSGVVLCTVPVYAGNSNDSDPAFNEEPVPMEVSYPDGEYSIEVNMTGGSGRASISSPTYLTVKDGRAYARLLWSSVHYDYVRVGNKTYYNLAEDGGNSVFEIPVLAMDRSFPIIGDTTAMGDPVEIRYELTFYQESIQSKGAIPQEAAKRVLIVAGCIIVFGGILDYFVNRKRRRA
ncbi:hypothetical protein SAMN06296386_10345 [Lachnospiraceae bacterium]|nr:hypothetical protein SAMN06296386_10345 [Lachnospiraceae bacterium]